MTSKAQQKKNRKAWTKALRSGDFKQGKSHLEKDGLFCCLGVLCNISGVSERKDWGSGIVSYDGDTSSPREKVREWVGLKTESGLYEDEKGIPRDLMGLNDSEGWTFEQIADVIDSEPKGLFE